MTPRGKHTRPHRVTLADIRAAVRAQTPAMEGHKLTVTWLQRPRAVVYPTGLRGYHARVRVEANGFRTREYLVQGDDEGWRMT